LAAARLRDLSELAALAALVFVQNPQDPIAIRKLVLTHAVAALNHGCNVIVRAAPAQQYQPLVAMLSGTELHHLLENPKQMVPPPFIRIDDVGTSWDVVAEFAD